MELNLGRVVGSLIYSGDKISGTSATPTSYNTGIENALPGDTYISTANGSKGNYYQCTVGGDQSTAKWVFKFNQGDESEAWAKGTRNGVPVSSEDPTYENNSKFFSEQSASQVANAEAWANGTRDGVEVDSSDPVYGKYARYYAEQAEDTLEEVRTVIGETIFSVNFTTGELEYTSPNYTFNVNEATGELEWEVA